MKNIFILLIALTTIATAFGRDITGKVVGENESPMDYVNVVLYSDSTYITGTVTDSAGIFSVNTDTNGNLIARISFVGYETISMPVPSSGNLGVIRLTPSVKELGEVVVKASRPSTTMKGNALVTNIEGSSLAIAGTANDVLAHVPMVVDNGGTLEVFGKGAPEIYINGRKVNDLQELSQLNSQDMKNVSVIYNRENETCNFQKRNEQNFSFFASFFLLYFRPLKHQLNAD